MIGETTYKITVSRADSDVIKNLVDILENCPMGLNNDDLGCNVLFIYFNCRRISVLCQAKLDRFVR